jgi:DNA-binding GntR family transcriptional regulator
MTEPLPESTPPKLQRSPLAEGAYGAIKKMIVETTLSPGQTLTETQLAVTLGISRSPIRQALVRLQEDGFVEIEPWKQARVAPLTPDVVREIYSVRTALEARAARESAPFIADADIVAMDATLKRLEPRIRVGDYAEFIAIEHQFHSLFIDNCRNRLLRDLLDDLQDHLERVRRYYRDEVGLHKEQEFEEHRRIIAAMATHAPDTLEQAVREHVEGFTVRLLADLTQATAGSAETRATQTWSENRLRGRG